MVVLTQSINDGFAQITTLLKQVNNTLKGNQGDLTKLSTADKTSLVNALNELKTTIDNKSAIDDSQTRQLTHGQRQRLVMRLPKQSLI